MKPTLLPYYVTQRDKAAPVTAPVPADPDLPRTCVIGAGSAGLACAKNLYLAGVPFDCFEKGSRIGGNWLIDNPNGVSACYDHLEISTSVRRMAFSDFPMPADYPPYARHDQVAAYFDDYAEHFGLLPLITFDTEVTSVEPVDPGDQGGDAAGEMRGTGRWRVTTRGPGGEVTRDYDAVIVCNGHHWYPRLPDPAYPGQDEFAGEQIHAHSYRDASQLAGRDVVVVGAGNSALDISSAAARTANSATISQRRGQWVIPKYTAGIASDLTAVPGWAPWLLNRIRLRVSSWTVRGLDKWGLPRPAHAPSQSHPVQSEEIRAAPTARGPPAAPAPRAATCSTSLRWPRSPRSPVRASTPRASTPCSASASRRPSTCAAPATGRCVSPPSARTGCGRRCSTRSSTTLRRPCPFPGCCSSPGRSPTSSPRSPGARNWCASSRAGAGCSAASTPPRRRWPCAGRSSSSGSPGPGSAAPRSACAPEVARRLRA